MIVDVCVCVMMGLIFLSCYQDNPMDPWPMACCRVFAGLARTLGATTNLLWNHQVRNDMLGPLGMMYVEWGWMRYQCKMIRLHKSSQSRRSWPVQDLSPKPAWILPLSADPCCWLPKHSTQEMKKKHEQPTRSPRVSTDAGIFNINARWNSHGDPKMTIPLHRPSGFIAHLCQKRCYLGSNPKCQTLAASCNHVKKWCKIGDCYPFELWQDRSKNLFLGSI